MRRGDGPCTPGRTCAPASLTGRDLRSGADECSHEHVGERSGSGRYHPQGSPQMSGRAATSARIALSGRLSARRRTAEASGSVTPRASRPPVLPRTRTRMPRTIRPVKVQQRSSGGCWRALQGLADFALVQSCLSAAANGNYRRAQFRRMGLRLACLEVASLALPLAVTLRLGLWSGHHDGSGSGSGSHWRSGQGPRSG